MSKVTYTPSQDPADDMPAETSQYGYDFTAGKAVEVDGKALAKFVGHPFFKVDGAAADPTGLRAVHNGGGRFIIVRGDKDQKVKDGLTKADSDAFNALSDADKEAYVAD